MNSQSAQQLGYTLFKLENNTTINMTINSDLVASYFILKPNNIPNFELFVKILSSLPYATIELRTWSNYIHSIIAPMRNSKNGYGKKARIITNTYSLVAALTSRI